MAVGGIAADDQHDIGVIDRGEILGAGGCAERHAQAIAGRRMADAGAGVDIVVAKGGAHHFLQHEDFFVGAARGGDGADGLPAIFRLHPLQFAGRMGDGLIPGNLAPGVCDPRPDHRPGHAVLVGGVAIGEAALDAAMAVIGLAALVGDHADELLALHFRLEGAADAAIGAGRDHGMLGKPMRHHAFLDQRSGGAGLDAGAAGDAFRFEEIGRARFDAGFEAPAFDRQSEGSLHLLAGADAAAAYDAFRRIISEIGVRIRPLRHRDGWRRRHSALRAGRLRRRPR